MKKYLLIGAGGFMGALARYGIKSLPIDFHHPLLANLPYYTFIANITGSFLLGIILTATKKPRGGENVKYVAAVGFLGAYTTFSTFCKETVILLGKGNYTGAFIYVTLSILLGLVSCNVGIVTAKRLLY